MNTRRSAQDIARYGRNGDSLLLHVHPIEVDLLNWGLKALGGQGVTVNPHTGMPEAFSLWDIVPIVAGAAGTVVGGPAGGMAASSLASAAKTAAQGGTAQQALLSGVISGATSAAGGAGGAATGAATDAAAQTAGNAATSAVTDAAAKQATDAAAQEIAKNTAQGATMNTFGGQTAADMMAQGGTNAGAAAGAGPLAQPIAGAGGASEMSQMTALPQEAVTPQMMEQFGTPQPTTPPPTDAGAVAPTTPPPTTPTEPAPTTPTSDINTPSELKSWESQQPALQAGEEEAQHPLMTKAKEFANSKYAVPAAVAGLSLASSAMQKKQKDPKYKAAQWKMNPTYLGGRPSNAGPGEHRYFSYAQGRAVDMNADHGDGMADKTQASIDGHQPAALSSGEYVVPADVVSHLGNGSSGAGVKALDEMLSRVRKTRTGGISQAPKINPKKVMPK